MHLWRIAAHGEGKACGLSLGGALRTTATALLAQRKGPQAIHRACASACSPYSHRGAPLVQRHCQQPNPPSHCEWRRAANEGLQPVPAQQQWPCKSPDFQAVVNSTPYVAARRNGNNALLWPFFLLFFVRCLRCFARCVQWKEQHPAIPAPHSHSPHCCTHSNAGNGGQISGKPCFLVTNSSAIPPRVCCDMAIAPSAVDGKLASNSTTPWSQHSRQGLNSHSHSPDGNCCSIPVNAHWGSFLCRQLVHGCFHRELHSCRQLQLFVFAAAAAFKK